MGLMADPLVERVRAGNHICYASDLRTTKVRDPPRDVIRPQTPSVETINLPWRVRSADRARRPAASPG